MLQWVALFFIFDVASLAAYTFPALNWLALCIILFGTLWLLMRDRRWMVFIPLAELLWGSFGSSFTWSIQGAHLSLRLVLFGTVVAYWLIRCAPSMFRSMQKDVRRHIQVWLLLVCMALWGAISGIAYGNQPVFVFLDGNAYLYLIYALVWWQAIDRSMLPQVRTLLFGAAWALSLKTVVLFHIFANGYELFNVPYLYMWIRDTRIGEITWAGGSVWRIFIQSQLFIGAALVHLSIDFLRSGRIRAADFILGIFFFAALMASLSRSFWLASVITLATVLAYFGRQLLRSLVTTLRTIGIMVGMYLCAVTLLIVLALFPSGTNISDSVAARLQTDDPATNSRLQLLRPLWQAVQKRPVLGSGFGTTVTYASDDPRIKTPLNPSGQTTTYAFEWGYLDQWLKLGLVGMAALFYVLVYQFWLGWTFRSDRDYRTAVAPLLGGLWFIMVVHVASPYLNHPLGLGYLALVMVVLGRLRSDETAHH